MTSGAYAGITGLGRALSVAWIVLLLLLLLLPLGCRPAGKTSVVVAGSNSIQPFAEIVAEDYMKLHPGLAVDVQDGGSSAGIRAAFSGTADIGMSSRELIGNEKELWSVEIARDGLALIVNHRNPVDDLTLARVRDIYAGVITRWDELGGSDSRIHVVAREGGSGTRGAFEEMVMGKTEITPRAIIQDASGAIRQIVADDPSAIGFISLGLVDSSVKALRLGGAAATKENVMNGSYGLSRPFLFLSRGEPAGQAKQFIDFVLSEAGRKILDNEGLITSEGSPVK